MDPKVKERLEEFDAQVKTRAEVILKAFDTINLADDHVTLAALLRVAVLFSHKRTRLTTVLQIFARCWDDADQSQHQMFSAALKQLFNQRPSSDQKAEEKTEKKEEEPQIPDAPAENRHLREDDLNLELTATQCLELQRRGMIRFCPVCQEWHGQDTSADKLREVLETIKPN